MRTKWRDSQNSSVVKNIILSLQETCTGHTKSVAFAFDKFVFTQVCKRTGNVCVLKKGGIPQRTGLRCSVCVCARVCCIIATTQRQIKRFPPYKGSRLRNQSDFCARDGETRYAGYMKWQDNFDTRLRKV